MNGNYPYSEEGAYVSEGFSLKPDLIKSAAIKRSPVTGAFLSNNNYVVRVKFIFFGSENDESLGFFVILN